MGEAEHHSVEGETEEPPEAEKPEGKGERRKRRKGRATERDSEKLEKF
jgi:hypothetical protein